MARKRTTTSRIDKSLINYIDRFVEITEQLSETISSFDSKLNNQKGSSNDFKRTNGILTSIRKKMPKKGSFSALNRVISSNTKALSNLSSSISNLSSKLSNLSSKDLLGKSETTNNLNVSNEIKKNTNLNVDKDINQNIKSEKSEGAKKLSSWESYRLDSDQRKLRDIRWQRPLRIAKIIEGLYKPIDELNKGLDVSYDTLFGMLGVTKDLYFNFDKLSGQMLKYGVGFASILETQKNIAEIAGTTNYLTDEQIGQVSVMSKKFGVANKDMAELSILFDAISNSSVDTNENLLDQIGVIGDLNGMIPSQLYQDLSNSSEKIALFGYKNIKNLKEAVILSKKWSMNIEKTYSFMDNMMFNFEGTVEKLIEIQALTGQQIDINKLWVASMSGDAKAVTEMTRDIVKGAENPIAIKAIANLIEYNTKQLQNIGKNKEDSTIESITPSEQEKKGYEHSWQGIISIAKRGVDSVVGVASAITSIFQLRRSHKDLVDIKKRISELTGVAGKSTKAMGGLGRAIGNVSDGSGELAKSGEGLDKFGGSMKSAFNPKTILSIGALMISLAGSFWIITDALKGFKNIGWDDLGKAGATFGVFIGAVAVGMYKLAAAGLGITEAAIPIGLAIATIAALAGSFWVFAQGAEVMSNAVSNLTKNVDSLKIVKLAYSITVLGGLSVPMSFGLGILSASLLNLSLALYPLTKIADKSENLLKLPESLNNLSAIDLGGLKKSLSPLDSLIEKLREIKSLIHSVNGEKIKIQYEVNTNKNQTNSQNQNSNNNMLLSNQIRDLISAVRNNSTINLSNKTINDLASEIKA